MFLPLVGIVIAIVLLTKGTRNKAAGWMLGVNLAWGTLVVVILVASAMSAATATTGLTPQQQGARDAANCINYGICR